MIIQQILLESICCARHMDAEYLCGQFPVVFFLFPQLYCVSPGPRFMWYTGNHCNLVGLMGLCGHQPLALQHAVLH